jgi:hypothetical protein
VGQAQTIEQELLGLWAMLTLAIRLHIYDLQVVGDSKLVIDWLNNQVDLQAMGLHFWKKQIESLIMEFSAIEFIHSFREFNQEADNLSKHALGLQEGMLKFYRMEDGQEGPPLFLSLY